MLIASTITCVRVAGCCTYCTTQLILTLVSALAMSCVFPSSTPSAEAWIESLNLHQYAPLFAHLTVEELYHLTDLQLKLREDRGGVDV